MTCTHVSGDVASGHGAAIGLVRAEGFGTEIRGKPCLARNKAKFGSEKEHQTKTKNQWTDPLFAVDTKLFCLQCLSRVRKQRWGRHGRVGLRLAAFTLIFNITTPLWDAWEETQKLSCPWPPPPLSLSLSCGRACPPRRGPVIGGEQHLSREPVTTRDPDWPLRTWPCRVRPTWIELLCARAYICMRRRVAVQSKHKGQRKVSAFLSVDDALQKSARVCRLNCGKCSIFWLSWDFVFALRSEHLILYYTGQTVMSLYDCRCLFEEIIFFRLFARSQENWHFRGNKIK